MSICNFNKFLDIEKGYSLEEALEESNRCLNCKNPKCVYGCPIQNDIPGFIQKIKEFNLDGANEILNKTSGFSNICSYVCYSENQCMAHCIKGLKDRPINIKLLERYVSDNTANNYSEVVKNNHSICVIGSGPAGLAFSRLALLDGYDVDLYDQNENLGGLLRYAIPKFRLPESQILKTEKDFSNLGLKYHSKKITSLEEIPGYEAYFIATGTSRMRKMNISGEDNPLVIDWNDLLSNPNNFKNLKDKKVCVIGGGNVAIDSARTLLRLNASVSIIYRRTVNEMPCNKKELESAISEGVEIIQLHNPISIAGHDKLEVTTAIMKLGNLDSSSRPTPIDTGKTKSFVFDYLVRAIGSSTEELLGIELQNDKIKVDENFKTNLDKVYALGDCITGASTVVDAIASAKKAYEAFKQEHLK